MNKQNLFYCLLIGTIIPFILYIFFNQNHFFAYLSNSYFYIAAPCLIIAGFASVIKAGTFDFFSYSLRKYRPKQKNDYAAEKLNEEEPDNIHRLSQRIGTRYKVLYKIGAYFIALSLICLLLYYL